jgi:type VI secretion system secreted protein Hcp
MAESMFLKLKGIKGDSTFEHAKHDIEILSFSHGVSMPINDSHPSNVSVKHGRTDHQDITITKFLDSTTPKLNLHASDGQLIKEAEIHFFAANKEKPVDYYHIKLNDVLVTSVNITGTGDGLPIETVTLHYNKIHWTYKTLKKDSDGSHGSHAAHWDLEKNHGK